MDDKIKLLEDRIQKLENKDKKTRKPREPREPSEWQMFIKIEGAKIKNEYLEKNEQISQAKIMKICAERWKIKNN